MQTKPLLYGLIGFFIGGLLVSVAASTFGKPDTVSMADMSAELRHKTGDTFDEAFIRDMIEHHEGAIDMAELADANAKHSEVKQLSKEIIVAQKKEIDQMKQWQKDWGYEASTHSEQSAH